MEKNITITVKITEGFANEVLRMTPMYAMQANKTFDEKADAVVARFMNPLYKAMADYALKETKAQALAEQRAIEAQALEQAKGLVNITVNETPIV